MSDSNKKKDRFNAFDLILEEEVCEKPRRPSCKNSQIKTNKDSKIINNHDDNKNNEINNIQESKIENILQNNDYSPSNKELNDLQDEDFTISKNKNNNSDKKLTLNNHNETMKISNDYFKQESKDLLEDILNKDTSINLVKNNDSLNKSEHSNDIINNKDINNFNSILDIKDNSKFDEVKNNEEEIIKQNEIEPDDNSVNIKKNINNIFQETNFEKSNINDFDVNSNTKNEIKVNNTLKNEDDSTNNDNNNNDSKIHHSNNINNKNCDFTEKKLLDNLNNILNINNKNNNDSSEKKIIDNINNFVINDNNNNSVISANKKNIELDFDKISNISKNEDYNIENIEVKENKKVTSDKKENSKEKENTKEKKIEDLINDNYVILKNDNKNININNIYNHINIYKSKLQDNSNANYNSNTNNDKLSQIRNIKCYSNVDFEDSYNHLKNILSRNKNNNSRKKSEYIIDFSMNFNNPTHKDLSTPTIKLNKCSSNSIYREFSTHRKRSSYNSSAKNLRDLKFNSLIKEINSISDFSINDFKYPKRPNTIITGIQTQNTKLRKNYSRIDNQISNMNDLFNIKNENQKGNVKNKIQEIINSFKKNPSNLKNSNHQKKLENYFQKYKTKYENSNNNIENDNNSLSKNKNNKNYLLMDIILNKDYHAIGTKEKEEAITQQNNGKPQNTSNTINDIKNTVNINVNRPLHKSNTVNNLVFENENIEKIKKSESNNNLEIYKNANNISFEKKNESNECNIANIFNIPNNINKISFSPIENKLNNEIHYNNDSSSKFINKNDFRKNYLYKNEKNVFWNNRINNKDNFYNEKKYFNLVNYNKLSNFKKLNKSSHTNYFNNSRSLIDNKNDQSNKSVKINFIDSNNDKNKFIHSNIMPSNFFSEFQKKGRKFLIK